jgi:hypothetical protein
MKKCKFAAFLALFLGMILLCGCGSGYSADESTVFIKKDGSIVSTDVEEFDTDTYDEDGLKTYIDETISAYNNENGKDSVKRKSFSVKDGVATLSLSYASASDYSKFTGTEIFTGSVAEALAAGYSFDDEFALIENGEFTVCKDNSEFLNESGYKVVIIRGNTIVNVKGKIAYATTANTTYVDSDTIKISDGAYLFSSEGEGSTQGVTEVTGTEVAGTEVTGTESGTEAGETGSSVSDDDLLSATSEEDTEVVFDFGEEESEKEDTTSQVYTYIIYK